MHTYLSIEVDGGREVIVPPVGRAVVWTEALAYFFFWYAEFAHVAVFGHKLVELVCHELVESETVESDGRFL